MMTIGLLTFIHKRKAFLKLLESLEHFQRLIVYVSSSMFLVMIFKKLATLWELAHPTSLLKLIV